jgi:hypothetical protein
MKKFVKQQITSPTGGDCLRASIATLLGVSIWDLPNFCWFRYGDHIKIRDNWAVLMQNFLSQHFNKFLIFYKGKISHPKIKNMYYIMIVNTTENNRHAIVCRNGKQIYCPTNGFIPKTDPYYDTNSCEIGILCFGKISVYNKAIKILNIITFNIFPQFVEKIIVNIFVANTYTIYLVKSFL